MLFDTHAHYYSEAFDPDRDEVLSALPAAGVGLVLCPGCDLPTSRQSIDLAERYPHVYAAAGVHPEDALGLPADWLDQVAAMTPHPKVKAIGEIWTTIGRRSPGTCKRRSFGPSSSWPGTWTSPSSSTTGRPTPTAWPW